MCIDSEEIDWPLPGPLEGVKSRKRLIFEVEHANVGAGCGTIEVRKLALSLSSKILAVGDGRQAAELLLKDGDVLAKRHKDLRVLCLEPSKFSSASTVSDYVKAINTALLEHRPQIIMLSEVGSSDNAAWQEIFDKIVYSDNLWKFRGALVICAFAETAFLQTRCSERWLSETGRVSQRPCFHVRENVIVSDLEELQQDAAQITYCDLRFWIQKAQLEGLKITRFDAGGCSEGSGRLRGLIFHGMIENNAEFHVRFIFVPTEHRKSGIGSLLVRWVIEQASLMTESECRWISLECAHDGLLSWYEKFGFTDMSCGHVEGDEGQTRMEMRNVPVGNART